MANTNTHIPRIPKRVRKHVNPLADRTEINFAGFADTKPIIADIGAYKGEFVQGLIEQFGINYNYIVTEIRTSFCQYLAELFSSYDNVAVFGGDSGRNIRGLFASSVQQGGRIAYIFVNFPDPWFKEKHKKRRVVNQQFLDSLETLFDQDSELVFQTDQELLFRETQELVAGAIPWTYQEFKQPLWGIQSHWERVKVAEGKEIYRMKIYLK